MTRRGLEAERVRVFTEMTRNGASKAEAFVFIDMMWPIEVVRYERG